MSQLAYIRLENDYPPQPAAMLLRGSQAGLPETVNRATFRDSLSV